MSYSDDEVARIQRNAVRNREFIDQLRADLAAALQRADAAEAEAGTMRDHLATKLFADNGYCSWCHRHIQDPHDKSCAFWALEGSTARLLAAFLARLRAAPCNGELNEGTPRAIACKDQGVDFESWCWPCQSRSPNYGGTE